MKFKVINPKGFNFSGKSLKAGDTFEADQKSAHVQTGLHFKQIAEDKSKPEPEPKDPPKEDKPEPKAK